MVITSAPHRAGAYTDWASIGGLAPSTEHTVPVFAVSLRDGEALARAARDGASVSATLETTIAWRSPRTVVASIPGRDASRYWLISAHGDSDAGGPGADDNASGVAVVVELAARLSSLVRSGMIGAPTSTLRFAVWGSEYHSARAFILREGASLSNCDGVINLDQVGTGAEREAIYFESNDVPWNARLLRTFEQVGRDYVGRPGLWPEFSTTPSQGGTDAYAFLPRLHFGEGNTTMRLPATTVYTAAWDAPRRLRQTPGWAANGPDGSHVLIDYSRYYHSTGDTPERTTEAEPQNMVRAVQAVGVALLRLVYDSGGSAR